MATGAARKLAGREGQVYFTDVTTNGTKTKIANLTDIAIDVTFAEIDASDHDTAGWEDKLTGLGSFKGTAGKLYVTTQASQDAIYAAMIAGDTVTIEFRPTDAVGEVMYSGNAVFTGVKLNATNTGVQAYNVSFSGRGALTQGVIGQ